MKLWNHGIILIAGLVIVAASHSPLTARELTDARFQQLHKQLRPPKDAPWLTIPWRISLLDAQKVAAKEGKPIFIWAMDGHPLGCT